MKKFIIISTIFSLILITSLLFSIHHSSASQTTIKQSYKVIEVHKSYIVAESNKYKDELINFYYADESKKQSFKVNDKVVAFFQPYKNNYKIIDFVKVK